MTNTERREIPVVCSSYDHLVAELKFAMRVKPLEEIAPIEGDGFDHEDIASWIGVVDFANGEAPVIEIALASSEGGKTYEFNVQDQEAIRSLGEEVSTETLLYSMALTEAKMSVIASIAEDTYPAIAYQIAEYRSEMKKVRDEILKESNNFREARSFRGIPLMTSKTFMTLTTIEVVGMMILAACTGGTTETAKPSPSFTPFQPAPPSETVPAITPSPEDTSTMPATSTDTETALPPTDTSLPPTETNTSEPPTEVPTATEIVDVLPAFEELDKVELEINSRKVEFAIGIEQGSNVFDTWKEWGIVSLEINTDREDVSETLAKAVEAGFWQAYLTQNKDTEISYEDFVANPTAFKLNLIRFGENNKREVFELSLAEINRIEYRIIGNNGDPRLFIEDFVLSAGQKTGYSFDALTGTMVFYRSTKLNEAPDIKYFSEEFSIDETVQGALYGENIDRLVGILVSMGYSLQINSPLTPTSLNVPDYVEKLNIIFNFSGYQTVEDCKNRMVCNRIDDYGNYLLEYGLLKAIVEE